MELFFIGWFAIGAISVLLSLYDHFRDKETVVMTVGDIVVAIVLPFLGPFAMLVALGMLYSKYQNNVVFKYKRGVK